MLDGKFFFVQQARGVFQKLHAVGIFPVRIGVGKVRADVAESSGTEKRIAERVGNYVAIGVAGGSFVKGQCKPPIINLRPASRR